MTRRVVYRIALAAATVLALGACGARVERPRAPGIGDLRIRAAKHPNDPTVQWELAVAELLGPDGDASRAHDAVERARRLAPKESKRSLLLGLERHVHGEMGAAVEALLKTLELAAHDGDEGAAHVPEVAARSLMEMVDAVDDFRGRVEERLGALLSEPGRIGLPAHQALVDLAIELAVRRGDAEAVRRWAVERGCIREVRVLGPIGPRDLLGFDDMHGLAPAGPLPPTYDLGAGRGEQPTRDISPLGCAIHLGGGPVVGGGTTFVQGTFEGGGPHAVHVATPNPVELFIDGERVARLDARRRPTPRDSFIPLTLEAGRHEVLVKVTTRHPNPVLSLAVSPIAARPAEEGFALPEANGPFHTYVRAAVAMGRGDVVTARETLRRVQHGGPGSAAMLALGASVALSDPLRPADARRDEARLLLRQAARRDGRSWAPPLQLARLQAAEGRLIGAIEQLRGVRDRWPNLVVAPLALAEMLLQRGWEAEAEQVIERALGDHPKSCLPVRAALALAQRQAHATRVAELSRDLVACDARSDAQFQLLAAQRRWDEAEQELDRLSSFHPPHFRAQALTQRVALAQGHGDTAAVDQHLEALRQVLPRAATIPLAMADRALSRGEGEEAVRVLSEALAVDPAHMADLRWPRRLITGDGELEAWRLSGDEVIKGFEASEHAYDGPQVLVLDYTVVRVFEDGSALELTHNIFKLQSQEAVDERGEYTPPEGRILTLRTIKADGRHIEPDPIEGKDTISLPRLSPGDYVEYEYVRPIDPPAGFPGGAVGDRFYFRSFEIPFDRSELVVVAPSSLPLDLDPRGPSPRLDKSEMAGGLVAYRWRVDQSEPLVQEPQSAPPREWVPSVYWASGATWEAMVESLRDLLADRDIRDPAAVRAVRKLLRSAQADADKARALYAWVLAHIEENSDVFGQSAAMLATRTGSRARVLHYMLGLAGVPSELVIARDRTTDQTPSEVADDGTYEHLLVRLPGLEGTENATYLFTGQRGAPFGYLPPILRGQDALVLAPGLSRVELGPGSARDTRDVRIDVRFRVDGQAAVTVTERFTGSAAVSWREQLEEIPEAVREQRFGEQYVARMIRGAELSSLEIGGTDDPEAPLSLTYELTVDGLGREQGGRWLVPLLFPSTLAPAYARAAERSTPQLIAAPVDASVHMSIHAPVAAAEIPREVKLEGPGGASFEMRSRADKGRFEVERRIRIPAMRISPESYADFAGFCRAVDTAEAREFSVSR